MQSFLHYLSAISVDDVVFVVYWFALSWMAVSMIIRFRFVISQAHSDMQRANGLRLQKEWLWGVHFWSEIFSFTIWCGFMGRGLGLTGDLTGRTGIFLMSLAFLAAFVCSMRTRCWYKLYTMKESNVVQGG